MERSAGKSDFRFPIFSPFPEDLLPMAQKDKKRPLEVEGNGFYVHCLNTHFRVQIEGATLLCPRPPGDAQNCYPHCSAGYKVKVLVFRSP